MIKYGVVFFALVVQVLLASAAVVDVHEHALTSNDFPLDEAIVYYSPYEADLIGMVSELFSDDIQRVTGRRIDVKSTDKVEGANVVVIGTVGNNEFINNLASSGKIDVNSIKGDWERYMISVVARPKEGIDKALVIVGSDRRGAAYGTFHISEAIGVSPLYWWADVPPVHHEALFISPFTLISKPPTVKYRGIFINDEGWGFGPWSSRTFEPDLGASGPLTYAKVCELILRLKGNMLAPAMHPSTVAFNRIPDNRVVADRYGIVVTTSHCEPVHYNNTTEWDVATLGPWNFITNRDGINDVLRKRVAEVSQYENCYVLAARGIHDAGLIGVPENKKVAVTEMALGDQREMLTQSIGKPIDQIPQVFVPYKEVLEIYEKGLNLPDDVTIVWSDDNFGYIKRLSTPAEQLRKGGSGVYYHISYLGGPHDYLWLNTTPCTLIYEEMHKAYECGADRYWLLNVGDIKPGELGMKFFMDLAWDIDQFDMDKAYDYVPNELAGMFGIDDAQALKDIMSTYFLLGFQRKPESMGWGVEWNSAMAKERIIDTDFSFINYDEAEHRLAEYDRISDMAESILLSLPDEKQDAFFELVYYPVKGASLMNRKMLLAQKSRWYARQNRAATSSVAVMAKEAFDSIEILNKRYNSLNGGKWNRMMQLAPGWVATYQEMPAVGYANNSGIAEMQVYVPGQNTDYSTGNVRVLPCITPYYSHEAYMEIYNTGKKQFEWSATCDNPAIILSANEGSIAEQQRVYVDIDWARVPDGQSSGTVTIRGGGELIDVIVPVFKPSTDQMANASGCYIETNGCISIPGGGYSRTVVDDAIQPMCVRGLGYEPECLLLGDPLAKRKHIPKLQENPRAEYDFYSFTGGSVNVDVYALPLFALNKDCDTQYGVQIDDGVMQWMGTPSKEYSTQWNLNVIKNTAVSSLTLNVGEAGRHTLKIYCRDPGVVIQKIVIDFGGQRRSYLGPPSSPIVSL